VTQRVEVRSAQLRRLTCSTRCWAWRFRSSSRCTARPRSPPTRRIARTSDGFSKPA